MRFTGGGYIAAHGVRRQIKDVPVSIAAKEDCMSEMTFQFSTHQVAGNDAPGLAVDGNDVQHLMPRVHLHMPKGYLRFERLVSPDQQLLADLPVRIDGPLNPLTTKPPDTKQAR